VDDTQGDLPYTVPFHGGVIAENQAHFNSYSYMVGLVDVLDKAGVPIFEFSRVNHIKCAELLLRVGVFPFLDTHASALSLSLSLWPTERSHPT
jgi:hypothetical protein